MADQQDVIVVKDSAASYVTEALTTSQDAGAVVGPRVVLEQTTSAAKGLLKRIITGAGFGKTLRGSSRKFATNGHISGLDGQPHGHTREAARRLRQMERLGRNHAHRS
jgi:hypothetical protein